MIRFACSRCGKRFRKDDSLAGRRGKCSCGYVFRVPGVKVSQASVFVPADDDPPPFDVPAFMPTVQNDSTFRLRPTRKGNPSVARWLAPPWLAMVAAGYLSSVFRDEIRASSPSLEWAFPHWLAITFMYTFPLVSPILLSRMGCLSIGRWIILTVACFAVWMASGLSLLLLMIASPQLRPMPPNWVAGLAFLTSINCFIGGFGCMIAAGVHPKTPPASP